MKPRIQHFSKSTGKNPRATWKLFNFTSLAHCDCTDFNKQKNVKPCMHIYRVAIEMRLIEPKYFGWEREFVIANKLSREETERLVKIPVDHTQWGGWSGEIHSSGIQMNRQYRAYFINNAEIEGAFETSRHEDSCAWHIHGYKVSLNKCNCPDFLKRKLPFKHIYTAAISYGLRLPLTKADYEEARSQGLGMVFSFDI